MSALRSALAVLDAFGLVFFLVVGVAQLMLLASATRGVRDRLRGARRSIGLDPQSSAVSPRVSVLVPARNEAHVIVETVQALLTMEYSNLEVIVVNDGSSDATLDVLAAAFGLAPVNRLIDASDGAAAIRAVLGSAEFPDLVVVDAHNVGKAGALNTALSLAGGDMVCVIDADTIIEPRAIGRLVQAFLDDPEVVAAGGTIRPVNGCTVQRARVVADRAPRGLLASIQDVEYVRAFEFGRLGWNGLGGNIIISGAFGLFDRAAVQAAGGFSTNTVGEDMEIVLRLRRRAVEQGRSGRVSFVPDPTAWTEVPESLHALARQRDRWQRGLVDSLRMHRHMICRPRYGSMGMVVMPYFVLAEVAGPVVEAMGVVVLALGMAVGGLGMAQVVTFALVVYGLSLISGLWALTLDVWSNPERARSGEVLRRVRALVLEQVGYRQLTVYWRLTGLIRALRRDQAWAVQLRKGYPHEAGGDAAVRSPGSGPRSPGMRPQTPPPAAPAIPR